MATAPSLMAGTLDSEPRKRPTGVRQALRMTISRDTGLLSTHSDTIKQQSYHGHYCAGAAGAVVGSGAVLVVVVVGGAVEVVVLVAAGSVAATVVVVVGVPAAD